MDIVELESKLDEIAIWPIEDIDINRHLEQTEFLDLLLNTTDEDIPLSILDDRIYLYSFILPEKMVKGDYVNDLLKWDGGMDDSWGWGYSYTNQRKTPKIFKAFSNNSSKIMQKGTPISYRRRSEGRVGEQYYFELDQKLTHLYDLHYEESRNSYIRLNEEGDIVDVAKVVMKNGKNILTLSKQALDFYLYLTKSVLIRCFDRTIWKDSFDSWDATSEKIIQEPIHEIYARQKINQTNLKKSYASYLRGFQIIRCSNSSQIYKIITSENEEREYASFIAFDFKHNEIKEISTNPNELGNYFIKDDKPFGTSPVFFKPEVLLKYKQDPIKYDLRDRSISCRNSWGLQSYDINLESGQVHTYLVYLSRLPYTEQLHWKQYNEKPKKGISKRAFRSDFLGEFSDEDDPYSEIMDILPKFEKKNKKFWNCKDQNFYKNLHLVATDNIKEWTDEIHTLDKLIIEGFNLKKIREILISLISQDKYLELSYKNLGSIQLLKILLTEMKLDPEEITEITDPLIETHLYRTKFSGHASLEKIDIQKRIVKEYGSFPKHFKIHLGRIRTSFKLLGKYDFNYSNFKIGQVLL